VINGRKRKVRPPYAASREPQPVKSLWTRHFMNEVSVDVQERCQVDRLHNVAVPHFLKERLGHFQSASKSTRGMKGSATHHIVSANPSLGKRRCAVAIRH
jgi:hypothetical protein